MPGGLKNALDWASRPFANNVLRDKPVAVVGASTGLFGAVWAQAETRKVLQAIGAHVSSASCPSARPTRRSTPTAVSSSPSSATELAAVVGDLLRECRTPIESSRVAA